MAPPPPVQCSKFKVQGSRFKAPPDRPSPLAPRPYTVPFSFSAFQLFSIVLIVWLLFVELGTELWYRSHEWGFPRRLPGGSSSRETTRPFVSCRHQRRPNRFSAITNAIAAPGRGRRPDWQAVFLRWNPGRIAVHLAKSHTPETCLTATGREVVSQSDLRMVPVHGLQLPFRSYVVKDQGAPLHVFYCLWDDRANAQSFAPTRMTYANRLAPVLAGGAIPVNAPWRSLSGASPTSRKPRQRLTASLRT